MNDHNVNDDDQDVDMDDEHDRHIDGENHDIDYDRLGLRFGP